MHARQVSQTAEPAASRGDNHVGLERGIGRQQEDIESSTESDSGQSVASIRSTSPERTARPKSRKKRERKQFGALAHDLDHLLDASFAELSPQPSHSIRADSDDVMHDQPILGGKKMNKRTRQNMRAMEVRRLKREQAKAVVAQQVGPNINGKQAHMTRPLQAKFLVANQGKAQQRRETAAAVRKGMTAQKYQKAITGSAERRRSRKKDMRNKAKQDSGEHMDLDI